MDNANADVTDDAVDDAAMEAAFAAEFSTPAAPQADAPKPAEAVTAVAAPAEVVKEEKKDTPAEKPAPPASGLTDDQVRLLAILPELEKRLTQQVDKVAGNYGELKRLFEETRKAAATPKGAAEFDASKDGDYIAKEFPELAKGIEDRLDQAIKAIPLPTGITQEQFEALYVERRQREQTEARNQLIAILDKAHPDRHDIQKTPEWEAWSKGLATHQRDSLENSEDPYYVSGMLSKFKVYRDKQALAAKQNQKRIVDAVTPNGVRPASPSAISEEEAAQKAFEAQFN